LRELTQVGDILFSLYESERFLLGEEQFSNYIRFINHKPAIMFWTNKLGIVITTFLEGILTKKNIF